MTRPRSAAGTPDPASVTVTTARASSRATARTIGGTPYFAAFSIVSVRERRWFWSSAPNRVLVAAVGAELVVGTALTRVGLPSLAPLPWEQTFAVLGYALFACLVVNDALKVALLRWRVLSGSG